MASDNTECAPEQVAASRTESSNQEIVDQSNQNEQTKVSKSDEKKFVQFTTVPIPPAISQPPLGYLFAEDVCERTPTETEYHDRHFRGFMRLLEPKEARFVVPSPFAWSQKYSCVHNVLNFLLMLPTDTRTSYEVLFGFVLYVDPANTFFRANGHVWLREIASGKWVDPTPLVDPRDARLLLVQSDHFLTMRERQLVMKSPGSYCLGAMVSHGLIPRKIHKSKHFQFLGTLFHTVLVPAREMRLYLANTNIYAS